MSKSLYIIAIILLAVWVISIFTLSAAWLIHIILISGLIALLFAVMGTAVKLWCTWIGDILG